MLQKICGYKNIRDNRYAQCEGGQPEDSPGCPH